MPVDVSCSRPSPSGLPQLIVPKFSAFGIGGWIVAVSISWQVTVKVLDVECLRAPAGGTALKANERADARVADAARLI